MLNDFSHEELRKALSDRLIAKREFLSFCKYIDPKHPVEARHIQYLGHKLEQVKQFIETGGKEGIGRLMIFMPPRYWKSQTASRKFPAWLLGNNPDLRIILTSYGADLASKHSKEVRDLIESDRYSTVFGEMASGDEPVLLDPDSRSSAAWELAGHSGGMIATGVGGAVTGFGANLFIIDDPVKGRDDASSAARRETIFEWFRSVAWNRLDDVNSAIILIMTRWDQEDLAGKLLTAMVSDEEADQYDIVFMPAEALELKDYPKNEEDYVENLLRGTYIPRASEGDQLKRKPGEPLWPNKHDTDALKKVRANIGDFEYMSQFGQRPRLAVGEFLDDDDFQIVQKAPDGVKWYWPTDLALGETETSDFNIGGAIAMKGEDLFIRDVVKIRDIDLFLPELRSIMISDEERGYPFGIESVAFQKLVLKQFMADRALVNTEICEIQVAGRGDKVERARPWRRRAKAGHVFLVKAKWNTDFIRVVTSFPKGRHDDEADFISNGVQMIAEDASGTLKTVSAPAVVVSAEEMFQVSSSMFQVMDHG
jgi:predicted phage terminase large subunit-like protein